MPITTPPTARCSTAPDDTQRQADHVDVQKAVIERLIEHHGWYGDRIMGNWAAKNYATFAGHTRASVWVTPDQEYEQVWLKGEFHSAGENVLAGCFGCIREPATSEAVHAAVDAYIVQAEKAIEGAFSVRVLRARQGVPDAGTEDDAGDAETNTYTERNA